MAGSQELGVDPHQNDDTFFNDLSRRPSHRSTHSESPTDNAGLREEQGIPRPKRIACILCRKRKLKCDGMKPSCGTCSRLVHNCAYDEVRRKSGPKRGYVKELEARLAQVETQLKTTKGQTRAPSLARATSFPQTGQPIPSQPGFQLNDLDMGLSIDNADEVLGSTNMQQSSIPSIVAPDQQQYSWEMIGLGLDEPLPPQEMIDELQAVYFEKIHPSTPMIHKYRYLAAMNLAPKMRPPVCLRYAMWALACSIIDKFSAYQDIFYQRARRYAEADEMKGHGEQCLTVAHAQTWCLLTAYEFKMMYFPRAWLSTGRSVRLTQMMSLHRIDGVGLEVKQVLPPARDWTDKEERRRTWWASFCADRYGSIGTGWPMSIEEKDIMTNLPSTDEAFEKSRPEMTPSLSEALSAEGSTTLSPYAGVALMACLFGRNLLHLHRPDPNDRPEDVIQGEFWKRHRYLDKILTNTSMFMPDHLRLPAGVRDPNIVFLNMNIHTSAICLHQAAILKAEKMELDQTVVRQSRDRCYMAATEIVGIMRLISHVEIGAMHPFMSFCLYVGARVFLQHYKRFPNDQDAYDSLDFLLNAMQAIRRKHPLTESFLVQLIVDLEGTGLDNPLNNSRYSFAIKKGIAENISHDHNCAPGLIQTEGGTAPFRHVASNATSPSSGAGSHHLSPDMAAHMPNHNYQSNAFPVQATGTFNPYTPQAEPKNYKNYGILPSQGWADAAPTGPDTNNMRASLPSHADPRHLSDMAPNAPMDMEMGSEHSGELHNRTSLGSTNPTPSNSYRSSVTSYSPPLRPSNATDIPNVASYLNPPPPWTVGFVSSQTPAFGESPSPHPEHRSADVCPNACIGAHHDETHKYNQQQPHHAVDGFPTPQSWEMSGEGGTGLSPLGEQGWSQMLEGMTWDSGMTTGVGAGDIPWRGGRFNTTD